MSFDSSLVAPPDSPGPVALVTGGGSGLGFAIAQGLLSSGHRVFILCRDRARGELARARLRQGGGAVEVIDGDLRCLGSARAAADAVARACPRLDVLVHNAGVWPVRRVRNEDGFETSFFVNHLAPFLVTARLRPVLPRGSRIVQVTAGLYGKGRVDLERTPAGDDFHPLRTYATTKLFNLLATRVWSERLRAAGVDVHAVHPGVVRTALGATGGPLGALLWVAKRFWATPAQGARGPVHVATSAALAGRTGLYFDQTREAALAPVALDDAAAHAVWSQADRLTSDAGLPAG